MEEEDVFFSVAIRAEAASIEKERVRERGIESLPRHITQSMPPIYFQKDGRRVEGAAVVKSQPDRVDSIGAIASLSLLAVEEEDGRGPPIQLFPSLLCSTSLSLRDPRTV